MQETRGTADKGEVLKGEGSACVSGRGEVSDDHCEEMLYTHHTRHKILQQAGRSRVHR